MRRREFIVDLGNATVFCWVFGRERGPIGLNERAAAYSSLRLPKRRR